MSGGARSRSTGIGALLSYGCATRCPVLIKTVLRMRDAMSGTDIRCLAATSTPEMGSHAPTVLRTPYAMSGTGVGLSYAWRCPVPTAVLRAYGCARRCPVLTWVAMVLCYGAAVRCPVLT
eukprot:543065-Rhodomonas_salina.3